MRIFTPFARSSRAGSKGEIWKPTKSTTQRAGMIAASAPINHEKEPDNSLLECGRVV